MFLNNFIQHKYHGSMFTVLYFAFFLKDDWRVLQMY